MARRFDSLSDPELITLINNGCIGVIPTDTVYGLVAQATNEQALQKLYQTKRRELPPGTMISASIQSLASLGFDRSHLERVAHYWPAALSVVLDAANIPTYLKQNRNALPVRIPDMASLTSLLNQTGPLMTTSANAPKQPTSTSVQMAVDYFGDEVDFYVDGGDLSGRPPSTIIGFDPGGGIIVYRQGAVNIEDF
jgi:L-threonylcarbamoyladenylate synthase